MKKGSSKIHYLQVILYYKENAKYSTNKLSEL